MLTSRRERNAARARRADARAELFLREKRDLFVRVLQAVEQQLKDYEAYWRDTVAVGGDISLPTGVLDRSRWEALSAEIDLLAPDVVPRINACLAALHEMDLAMISREEQHVSDADKKVRVLRAELRDSMRVSLNVADPDASDRK